jgi:hypothetical protein
MPKLAEALIERKTLIERLQRLCERLEANAKVQEGETPDEQPAGLLAEALEVLEACQRLNVQINRTNMHATLSDGATLMEAIAERDRLKTERNVLERLANAARIAPARGLALTRNEVKWRPTVEVAAIQKQIDTLSQRYRELDTRIQEANWLTDLLQD